MAELHADQSTRTSVVAGVITLVALCACLVLVVLTAILAIETRQIANEVERMMAPPVSQPTSRSPAPGSSWSTECRAEAGGVWINAC